MALSTGALVVFALVGVALVLFVTERLPPDITAIGVLVSLAILEPVTSVSASEAIVGFASPAVVTIIGMYVLSGAVEATGVVDWLGSHLAALTHGSERGLLAATLGSTGLSAGFVNNTPVVAVFIPMISGLASDANVSPSKFLMPLSFAAMLGGTLTVVGSSLNLLASDVSARLLDHPIGMFEISALGLLVLGAGLTYLLTVGYRLTPARATPTEGFTAEYDLDRHLSLARVRGESSLAGRTAGELVAEGTLGPDVAVLQVQREREVRVDQGTGEEGPDGETATTTVTETFIAGDDRPIEAGDLLTVRGSLRAINRAAAEYGLQHLPRVQVDDATLEGGDHRGILAEVVLPPDSGLIGETPRTARLLERFDTTVLAIRRGETVTREGLAAESFRAGDTVLLQTTPSAIEHLGEDGDAILTETTIDPIELPRFERPTPVLGWRAAFAVGTLFAVVVLGGFTPLAIPVAALGGVVAVVAGGCLSASEAYDTVSWNVVFLLAGLLPLGIALQRTGGAAAIGDALSGVGAALPPIATIALVYLFASLLAAAITPVATIVLLTPIAIDLAAGLGVSGFAFVLATLFGASAAFLTPIGYQTNLMVYGPGAYRFTDYARVGAPLLALLTVVTTVGITVIYGL